MTPETVVDAEKALDRLDTVARRFSVGEMLEQTASGYVVEGTAPATAIDADALAAFRTRMDDDLDTPGALADIFDLVSAAHTSADAGRGRSGARVGPDGRGVGRRPRTVVEGRGLDARPARPPVWWPSATRPGERGISPGPTRCGTNWSPWAGPSRTLRPAPPSALNRPHRPWRGADLTQPIFQFVGTCWSQALWHMTGPRRRFLVTMSNYGDVHRDRCWAGSGPRRAHHVRLLPRTERGSTPDPEVGPRIRRDGGPTGRSRMGRARRDAVADHPGGGPQRPVLLRLHRPVFRRSHRPVDVPGQRGVELGGCRHQPVHLRLHPGRGRHLRQRDAGAVGRMDPPVLRHGR